MCSFMHSTSTGQSFERQHGQRQNPVPCPSFVILPRKIYVIQDVDQILSHQQTPVRSTIMECYAQSSSKLLEFHRVKAHQVQSMASSIAFYLKDLSLYSLDLIHLGPVVAAETILPSTGH